MTQSQDELIVNDEVLSETPVQEVVKTGKPKKAAYLENSVLLEEVKRAKDKGFVTDKLGAMILLMCRKVALHPYFRNYTYIDDMISEAALNLCKNALKFDSDNYSNPFAYYTQAIMRSFSHYKGVEKKQRNIRDELLISLGENPSFTYIEEHANKRGADFAEHDRESIAELSQDIQTARENKIKRLQQEAAKQEALAIEEDKLLPAARLLEF